MLNGKKVLIVDTAESVRHFIRHILVNAGFRVFPARTAREALDLAREYDFDVVLTDIHIPDMDGLTLIRELRGLDTYESTPILAVTMANSDTLRQEGKAAGATAWITKPVSPTSIVDLLKKLLRNTALQEAHLSA